MTLYGSVCGFVFVYAVRGNQYGSHHGEGTERGRNHIGHYIAVVVLACPDKAALCFHDPCYRIVNQGVEIGNAGFLKFRLVFVFVNLSKNILEGMVILFGNGILCGKP